MSLAPVSPQEARRMVERGARIVDIRSPQEFGRSHLPGAENHPLGSIEPLGEGAPIIFMCRSGKRSALNAQELRGLCEGDAYTLEGGLEGWRKAGFPLSDSKGDKIDLPRQIQLIVGGITLVGMGFGIVQSPIWFIPVALLAIDQLHAGFTGKSAMAWLLSRLPGNRNA